MILLGPNALRLVAPLLMTVSLPLGLAEAAVAQSGGIFEITRSTIDGGGTTDRAADNLVLRATVGQPDVEISSNGTFEVSGGFWPSAASLGLIFADGFESGNTSAWSSSLGELSAPPGTPPGALWFDRERGQVDSAHRGSAGAVQEARLADPADDRAESPFLGEDLLREGQGGLPE